LQDLLVQKNIQMGKLIKGLADQNIEEMKDIVSVGALQILIEENKRMERKETMNKS
jgi:hypothetical protein